MKKVFVFVAFIQSALGYGMDKCDLFKYNVGHTCIRVTNRSIQEFDGAVDIMVVGAYEQFKLETRFFENLVGGDIYLGKKYLNVRARKNSDVCYKPFDYSLSSSSCGSSQKSIKSCLLSVVEPRLGKELLWNSDLGKAVEDFTYITHRRYHRDNSIHLCEYYAADALEEAKRDLFLCYENSLKEGKKHFHEKTNGSIAFKSLSTKLGFPRPEAASITVAIIIDYIKKNPTAYTAIYLCVDNRLDVRLYRKVFESASEIRL